MKNEKLQRARRKAKNHRAAAGSADGGSEDSHDSSAKRVPAVSLLRTPSLVRLTAALVAARTCQPSSLAVVRCLAHGKPRGEMAFPKAQRPKPRGVG